MNFNNFQCGRLDLPVDAVSVYVPANAHAPRLTALDFNRIDNG